MYSYHNNRKLIIKSGTAAKIICLLLLVPVLAMSGCADDTAVIRDMFLNNIVSSTEISVADATSRLQNIEKQIDELRVKRNALEQVATPAKEWISLQVDSARKQSWSRKTLQVIEDLPKLRNDKYEVTKLVYLM